MHRSPSQSDDDNELSLNSKVHVLIGWNSFNNHCLISTFFFSFLNINIGEFISRKDNEMLYLSFTRLQWTLLTSNLRSNSGRLQGKVSVAHFSFLLPIRWGYCPSHLLVVMLSASFNHPQSALDNVSISMPLRQLEMKVIKRGHSVSLEKTCSLTWTSWYEGKTTVDRCNALRMSCRNVRFFFFYYSARAH